MSFNWYFENWLKILLLVLGLPFRDRKSLRTKQTQVKLNAKRGWPINLINHIQPQLSKMCPKSSWTLTSQSTDGAFPYCEFQCYVNGVSPVRHQLLSSGSLWTNLVAFRRRYTDFHTRKCLWKCPMQNGSLVKTKWDVMNLYCDKKWWSFTDIP